MATFINNDALRVLQNGRQVIKTAQALPQTATANLFTVSGGSVLVTWIAGVFSTASGATVTTLALGTTPTVGTAANNSLATAVAITSLEAGAWVTIQNSAGKGGALVVGANAGGVVFLPTSPVIVPAGTITWTTSASDTGAITWYLDYVSLDVGASVS